MTKKELLAFIDTALRIEEDAVASYAKHLTATIEFSGFSKSECEQIRTSLKQLEDDSREHSQTLNSLRAKIVEDTRNVY